MSFRGIFMPRGGALEGFDLLKVTPIVNDKATMRTQVSCLSNHCAVLCISEGRIVRLQLE